MNIVIFIKSQLENYLVCITFLLPVRLQYQEHVEACEEPVQDKQALEAIDRKNENQHQVPVAFFKIFRTPDSLYQYCNKQKQT